MRTACTKKSYFVIFGLIFITFLLDVAQLRAQSVINAQSLGLGGGASYISGPESTFDNPANLMINNRYGNIHISLGQFGAAFHPVLSQHDISKQIDHFSAIFSEYKPQDVAMSEDERQQILHDNYPGNQQRSQHLSRTDLLLGGVSWQTKDAAFSVALRLRKGSRFEVGKGWYSDQISADSLRDFTFNQQRSSFYEFSMGYAQKISFFDGWLADLSRLYVGIAPKIVIAGPHFDARYHGRYDPEKSQYSTSFKLESSGEQSETINEYRRTQKAQKAVDNHLKGAGLSPTGLGLGFDFGLTYIIPLGRDLATINPDPKTSVISRSFRFALSIDDIGVLRYRKKPLRLSLPHQLQITSPPDVADSKFMGSNGQYLSYFNQSGGPTPPVLASDSSNNDSYLKLLPTSLNTEIMLQLSRLSLVSGLSVGLQNGAFTSTLATFHLGVKLYIAPALPIRLSTSLARNQPTRLGLGTGIETKHWDFNIGMQLINQPGTSYSLSGGAVAGIQLHF